ncbi:putative monovalent cation/H+ antiporter subunit A [Ignavibacteriales bacterium]
MTLFQILIPFLIAPFVPLIGKKREGRDLGIVLAMIPFLLFISFLFEFINLTPAAISPEIYQWIPSIGVELAFRSDGLSLLFGLIITGIGSAVFLFAGGYLGKGIETVKFYIYILIFMGAMLGIVFSDNLLLLFIFWELTSFSSFLLIGFKHNYVASRYAALQALLVTGLGGLSLLAGVILINSVTGTFSISTIVADPSMIRESSLLVPIIILILGGAFTKSAQVPFHFWLPNAMEAPTPVSAYLHSATMVKAGVFLVARLNPVFAGVELWNDSLMIFGGSTMVVGAFLALKQTDLKKILAYTTLSVLGTLIMLTGYGSDMALTTMIVYLTAHALYKGTLFLTAGAIDHSTGTRDVRILGGLLKKMPFTAYAGTVAAFSMAGMIPMVGFVGKELLYETALKGEPALFFGVLFAGVVMVYSAIQAGIHPYFAPERETPLSPHEGDFTLTAGTVTAATIGLILGVLASNLLSGLVSLAVLPIAGKTVVVSLGLWHGFNMVLFLSMGTIIAGYGLYTVREKLYLLPRVYGPLEFLMPSKLYDKALNLLMFTSKSQTSFFQNGYLRNYIITIFATAMLLVGGYFFYHLDLTELIIDPSMELHEAMAGVVIIAGAIIGAVAKSRLYAVMALGITGLGVALVFILYGAPDLALTQFSIETLSVILFVLAIYKLPKFLNLSNKTSKIRDLIIASAMGVFITFVILAVYVHEHSTELKDFFAAESLPGGKGRNIVNVILVDFRAIDTMGEIMVLGIAAIGIFGLVKLVKKGE